MPVSLHLLSPGEQSQISVGQGAHSQKGTEQILKSWNANIYFDDVTAQLMSVAMLHGSCNEVDKNLNCE